MTREEFNITWRGDPPQGYHGPTHWEPNSIGRYSSVIDRQAQGLGSHPGDWASPFDAWQELRWRLQAMGWRDVRPITRELVPT